jgi:hypothetical protein
LTRRRGSVLPIPSFVPVTIGFDQSQNRCGRFVAGIKWKATRNAWEQMSTTAKTLDFVPEVNAL